MFRVNITILFFVLWCIQLFPQNTSNEPKILFDKGNYVKCYEVSNQLLESYPNDPVYNYFAGASLFHTGENFEKCLEHFDKADSRLTPKELWLFKGKTLLYLYRIDEAKRAFELYAQNFSLRDAITGENANWTKVTENIKSATTQSQQITLIKRDTINQNSMIGFYNEITNTTGTWEKKNDEYFENQGIQPGEGIYYKFNEKTDKQCFVLTGKKSLVRTDLDIFYSCASGDIFEQSFQALPTFINSRKDQRYPIYDEHSQTLYYSSQGDKSFGGYDIFYSTFDKKKNRWSYPKNLGFPINSPFDDFLIGTSNDGGIYIATNRYQETNKIEIILLKPSKIFDNIDDPDKLLAKSKFLKEVKPKEIKNELASAIQKLKNDSEPEIKQVSVEIEQQNKEEEQKSPQPFSNEDEYKKQLDKALTLQLKADSVGRLADEKRYKLADIKDQKERIKEIRAIENYETEASEIQKEADIAFVRVRKMELEEEARNNKSANNIKSPSENLQQNIESNRLNDFKVYSSTPYSNQNPFNFDYSLPKGLLYRVQMGVFSKEISYDHFGGLSPVTGELIEERGLKKYYIGLFANFSEADKALQKIHQQGFIDSFIVAWFNGKKVSINRAEEIEKDLAR